MEIQVTEIRIKRGPVFQMYHGSRNEECSVFEATWGADIRVGEKVFDYATDFASPEEAIEWIREKLKEKTAEIKY